MNVDSITSHSVRVTWVAPYPPCANYYNLVQNLENLDQCNETSIKTYLGITHDTVFNVDGLKAYSTYKIAVGAINSFGYNGKPITITTDFEGEQTLFANNRHN